MPSAVRELRGQWALIIGSYPVPAGDNVIPDRDGVQFGVGVPRLPLGKQMINSSRGPKVCCTHEGKKHSTITKLNLEIL